LIREALILNPNVHKISRSLTQYRPNETERNAPLEHSANMIFESRIQIAILEVFLNRHKLKFMQQHVN
jgi:hypothetical protein